MEIPKNCVINAIARQFVAKPLASGIGASNATVNNIVINNGKNVFIIKIELGSSMNSLINDVFFFLKEKENKQ